MTVKKKRRSDDGGAGKSWTSTPRRAAGFASSRKSAFGGPKLDKCVLRSVPIASSGSPNAEVLTFKFTTGPHEVARLLPQPLTIKYQMKAPNPHRTTAVGDPQTDWYNTPGNVPVVSTNPGEIEFRVYVDPSAPTPVFFDRVNVVLDQEDVTLQQRGGSGGYLSGFTASAQRCFMNNEERKRWFGDPAIVKDSDDWAALHKGPFGAEQTAVLWKTSFGQNGDIEPRTIRLGFEGIPFMGFPKNFTLCKLLGVEPQASWGFLPPNTSVIVQLRRTSPHRRNLEQPVIPYKKHIPASGSTDASDVLAYHRVGDTKYFSDEALAQQPTEVITEILDAKLEIEVLKFDPSVAAKMLAKFDRPTMTYVFDTHDTQIQRVDPGQSVARVGFVIDRNVKLAVVNFAFQHNVFFDAASKHNCSYRAVLPDYLEKLTFTFMGEPVIAEELTGLAKKGSNVSMSAVTLKRYLDQRNLLDRDNPEIIPQKPNVKGYRMYFPLDLSSFAPDGARTLEVTMTFTAGKMSPAGLLVLCDKIYQAALTRSVAKGGQKDWVIKPGIDVSIL